MPWWDLRSLSCVRNLPGIFQDDLCRRLPISTISNDWFSGAESLLIEHWNEEQCRTMDVQFGSHTLRSHGVVVARKHMHDWLIFLFLVVMDIILNAIDPFYRFVGKDMMTDLKYPFKNNTVPVWAVPVYAVLVPVIIFLIVYYHRRDVYDLHHAILGLLYSVLVTGVLTDAIKIAVGRPRPNFFWRCFPDGIAVYDQFNNVVCHGDKHVVNEGHKSFPSGHTSWSFAGLGFLSLYISGKIKAFDRRGHVAKLCLVFLPLLFASLVGISRVDDYWHHWQDVFAGGLLGLVVATFCYLQFFPPPYHAEGWGPYAYFRFLRECESIQEGSPVNPHTAQTMLSEVVNEQHERNNNGFLGLQSVSDSNSLVNDVETARR
ncbi:lipid phosphate phosphatase 2 isoform X1 [Citrus clementina]|nr:lipid phosphate phosphatase 2 isoform X1 [Citrus x clementina]